MNNQCHHCLVNLDIKNVSKKYGNRTIFRFHKNCPINYILIKMHNLYNFSFYSKLFYFKSNWNNVNELHLRLRTDHNIELTMEHSQIDFTKLDELDARLQKLLLVS